GRGDGDVRRGRAVVLDHQAAVDDAGRDGRDGAVFQPLHSQPGTRAPPHEAPPSSVLGYERGYNADRRPGGRQQEETDRRAESGRGGVDIFLGEGDLGPRRLDSSRTAVYITVQLDNRLVRYTWPRTL